MIKRKDRQHSIRLPSDLSNEIQRLAEADGRSFSSMIERALRWYVDNVAKAADKSKRAHSGGQDG